MDETLAQILEACNLAKELEAELAALQNHPHYLLSSCVKVVEAFNRAIVSMQSLYPSPFAASAGLLYGGEGSSRGGGRVQEVNILNTRGLEGVDNPFFGRGPEEPQLGLEIPMPGAMTVAAVTAELRGVPGYTGDPQTEVGPFRGGRAEAEGPSTRRGRRPAGSRRDRGGETRTIRVPAVGSGSNPPDDGYTWRKYGQKNILGSRYPRSYFRCTHRNFYGCEAKKRLQRLDDDPYTYEVTYCGTHSCLTSTAPLLVPPLPLPTATNITTIATTTITTGPTMPFAGGGPSMGNPEGPTTAASLAEAMMITGQAPPLSTSIQLGSWLTRGLEGGSSHVGPSHAQGGGGRDTEWPVADLADTMFNSGSSGSSMDAIFPSTRPDNPDNQN